MEFASSIDGGTGFDRNSSLLSEYYYFGVLLRRWLGGYSVNDWVVDCGGVRKDTHL